MMGRGNRELTLALRTPHPCCHQTKIPLWPLNALPGKARQRAQTRGYECGPWGK
jgi:hypothetical protein